MIPFRARLAAATAAAVLLSLGACSPDQPTAPLSAVRTLENASEVRSAGIVVCHTGDDGPRLLELPASARAAHEGHGDYLARLVVRGDAGAADGITFTRIGDAIAAARASRVAHGEREAAACRITIVVAAGIYQGTMAPGAGPGLEQFPLVIDVPDLTLSGALVMQLDAAGRAAGSVAGASTLVAVPPVQTIGQYSEPIMFVNGDPGGFEGNGAIIEGFAFRAGHPGVDDLIGGAAIISLRVSGLVVRGNNFDGGFSESVDLRASSGAVERNHLAGGGGTCDICLAGPGDYRAEGNRLLAGGIPGILVVPTTFLPVPPSIVQYTLPAAATVSALLLNNEVRDHLRKPVGAGLRVGAIGVNAPNVAGTARVEARGNLLVNNTFGMIVEAAFPVPNTLRRGDIDLTLGGNVFSASCQQDFLVSLSRHTTGLGLSSQPYLLNSSYTLDLAGDIAWEDAWYSHPAGFGNTLTVNGVPIPNGAVTAYDPALTCTP